MFSISNLTFCCCFFFVLDFRLRFWCRDRPFHCCCFFFSSYIFFTQKRMSNLKMFFGYNLLHIAMNQEKWNEPKRTRRRRSFRCSILFSPAVVVISSLFFLFERSSIHRQRNATWFWVEFSWFGRSGVSHSNWLVWQKHAKLLHFLDNFFCILLYPLVSTVINGQNTN